MALRNPFTSKAADVVIAGGGVIGLSLARELARRGVSKVLLIERGRLGAEASWAAGGILAPQVETDQPDNFFDLACASRDLYPKYAEALRAETGIDVELDQTGTLYLGFSEREEQEMRGRYQWQTSAGLRVEWLTGAEARSLEPGLSGQVCCALRFPNDYQVENRRLVEALVMTNRKHGVELIENCEVHSLCVDNGRVTGVETSSGPVSSAVVVVAAGAWSSNILPAYVRIEPIRGQMLCFKAEPQIARHVIYSSRGYLVPRRDGRLLAGSTSEPVGFDKQVTETGVNSISLMGREMIPALKTLTFIDSWAGFRPRSEDHLPVIGADEDNEGLFCATGHYRNGILLAPITADLLAESIVSGNGSHLLEKFSPARFRRVAVGSG